MKGVRIVGKRGCKIGCRLGVKIGVRIRGKIGVKKGWKKGVKGVILQNGVTLWSYKWSYTFAA